MGASASGRTRGVGGLRAGEAQSGVVAGEGGLPSVLRLVQGLTKHSRHLRIVMSLIASKGSS